MSYCIVCEADLFGADGQVGGKTPRARGQRAGGTGSLRVGGDRDEGARVLRTRPSGKVAWLALIAVRGDAGGGGDAAGSMPARMLVRTGFICSGER